MLTRAVWSTNYLWSLAVLCSSWEGNLTQLSFNWPLPVSRNTLLTSLGVSVLMEEGKD